MTEYWSRFRKAITGKLEALFDLAQQANLADKFLNWYYHDL